MAVFTSRGSLPGPDLWLVLRRQSEVDTVRVFLCHVPRRVKPSQLAQLTGTRWAIETCFREGKQLLGLSDYEGRSWQGWHRYMTLCLLLHFFLLQGRRALKKTTRPDAVPAGGGPGGRAGPVSQPAPGRSRPPVPTPDVAGSNSLPDVSLQCPLGGGSRSPSLPPAGGPGRTPPLSGRGSGRRWPAVRSPPMLHPPGPAYPSQDGRIGIPRTARTVAPSHNRTAPSRWPRARMRPTGLNINSVTPRQGL